MRTACPDSKAMDWTTPPASVVTSVPLSATRVPTASAVPLQRSLRASKVLTSTGGCGMLSKKSLVALPMIALTANTPPKITATPISIRIMRRAKEGWRAGLEEEVRKAMAIPFCSFKRGAGRGDARGVAGP